MYDQRRTSILGDDVWAVVHRVQAVHGLPLEAPGPGEELQLLGRGVGGPPHLAPDDGHGGDGAKDEQQGGQQEAAQ